MMIVSQLSVFLISIVSNDLSEVSINTSVTLSFTTVLELFLQLSSVKIYFDVMFYIICIFAVDVFSFNGGILFNCSGVL